MSEIWHADGRFVKDERNEGVGETYGDDYAESCELAQKIAKAVTLFPEMFDVISRIANSPYTAQPADLIDMARTINRKIREF